MSKPTSEIDVREVAHILDVHISYVYSLLWSGKLEARKQDGVWYVSRAAVERRQATTASRRRLREE